MAISPVNAAREGTWLTDDTEKSLFGSEPKFSVIRVKKRGVDSQFRVSQLMDMSLEPKKTVKTDTLRIHSILNNLPQKCDIHMIGCATKHGSLRGPLPLLGGKSLKTTVFSLCLHNPKQTL